MTGSTGSRAGARVASARPQPRPCDARATTTIDVSPGAERCVVDASAIVDLLLQTDEGTVVAARLRGATLLAPAHLHAEVLSALGRLHRAGDVPSATVDDALDDLADAPILRVPAAPFLGPAWALRDRYALRDALYVALATAAEATLVTSNAPLARQAAADGVTVARP
jgi:predicted nucleic acid-binding protein